MNHLLRPNRPSCAALAAASLCLVLASPAAHPQAESVVQFMDSPSPLLVHGSSQGYLGVDVSDVDSEKAQALNLKEAKGALITLIDHDAPAGQVGLKVNDVVVSIDGQPVDGADQLRHMLRELPPGRKISLVISRDGNIQTLAVQLADRKQVEHEAWGKIDSGGNDMSSAPGMGILPGAGGGDAPTGGGFHLPFFGSSLNVGALVEPLTSQMADYLGVSGGLMVKQVARKSQADTAGLRAFDVILKVGVDSIVTSADWDRALRSNEGKSVQVTILRDKKQQTLNLEVDSKHRGAVDYPDLYPDLFPQDGELLALNNLTDPDSLHELSAQAQAATEQAREQAGQALSQLDLDTLKMSRQQIDELRRQAEEMRKNLKSELGSAIKIDPNDLKLDPKQMDELRQKMDELRKSIQSQDFKIDPKQMDELRKQLQQMKHQFEGFPFS
jgi:membrane-associated protease RseP (regulator of RpoE activity)